MDPKPAPAIDLDLLINKVKQLASSNDLHIVPVTPLSNSSSGYLVLLGPEQVSADRFCELAAIAGAKLLYVQVEGFDVGGDPDPELWSSSSVIRSKAAHGRLVELRRDALRHDGRIRHIELAFTAGCVLHCWAAVADWYNSLVSRAAALNDGTATTGPGAKPRSRDDEQ
jgi:hypothetical protein